MGGVEPSAAEGHAVRGDKGAGWGGAQGTGHASLQPWRCELTQHRHRRII